MVRQLIADPALSNAALHLISAYQSERIPIRTQQGRLSRAFQLAVRHQSRSQRSQYRKLVFEIKCQGESRDIVNPGNGTSEVANNIKLSSVLAGKFLLSVAGENIPVLDLWRERRAVITWARHFGCLLCRKRAAIFASKHAELVRADVALVLVGAGSPEQARTFVEQTSFPGEVLADPDFQTYRALQFVFGASTVLTPKAALNLVTARLEGFEQDWGTSLQKDTVLQGGWQQGGTLVVGPGADNLHYLHRDKEAGDEPDMEAVLSACCRTN